MKLLTVSLALLLAVAAATSESSSLDDEQKLERRRVDQLGKMMNAKTGRHFSSYLGYGNFCGLGGSGRPQDNIDACCQRHDQCFKRMRVSNDAGRCRRSAGDPNAKFITYLTMYKYTIDGRGNIRCLDSSSDRSQFRRCLRGLCDCDKDLAECLGRHKHEYKASRLKSSQALVRKLVRMAEKYPRAYDWAWAKVAKMMGQA